METKAAIGNMLRPDKANAFLWVNALCMLVGLFLLHWSAAAILTAYFFETIIIGCIHVIKMITVYGWSRKQKNIPPYKKTNTNHITMIPFFMVHYFFFVFVQSVFMFLLLPGEVPGIKEPFRVIHNYTVLLQQPDTQQAVALLFFTNVVIALREFFVPQQYHRYTVGGLFVQPYVRIFIQQFVVILSGFFMFIPGATVGAVLLILIRLFVDLLLFAGATNKGNKEKLLTTLTAKQDAATREKTNKILGTIPDEQVR